MDLVRPRFADAAVEQGGETIDLGAVLVAVPVAAAPQIAFFEEPARRVR